MVNKLKDISVLLFAGGQYCPYPFAPAHTGLSAGSLCNPPINYHRSNPPFSSVIRRLNCGFSQKTKVIFGGLAPEASGQLLGQRMIRSSSHSAQKPLSDLFYRTAKTFGSQLVVAIQCFKQFFEPFEQMISPAGQFFNTVLGKETNLTNQMSHAVLNSYIKQATVLAVRPPVVGTDDAGKVSTEYCSQHTAAARRINPEQAVIRRVKTPRPKQFVIILMTCFVRRLHRSLRV